MVSIIVACDLYGGIGRDGTIPWNIPEDMRRFREITSGHVVIMGRRTWESIPEHRRPLPARVNVVICHNPPNCSTTLPVTIPALDEPNKLNDALLHATSLRRAIEFVKVVYPQLSVFIIGGQRLYNESLELDLVNEVHLTLVHEHVRGCDVFFPLEKVYCSPDFSIVEQSTKKQVGLLSYSFITLSRCRMLESSPAEGTRLLHATI